MPIYPSIRMPAVFCLVRRRMALQAGHCCNQAEVDNIAVVMAAAAAVAAMVEEDSSFLLEEVVDTPAWVG